MAANTRLSVATHLLIALGHRAGEPLTSDQLAKSVRTHPVVLRRLLSRLSKAGLVRAQTGPAGGYELNRSLERITLLDVWRAVDDGGLFALHSTPINRVCEVSCGIRDALAEAYDRVDHAVESSLQRTRLSDLLERIEGGG